MKDFQLLKRIVGLINILYFNLVVALILFIWYQKQSSLELFSTIYLLIRISFLIVNRKHFFKKQPSQRFLIKLLFNYVYIEEYEMDYSNKKDIIYQYGAYIFPIDLMIIIDAFLKGSFYEINSFSISCLRICLLILGLLIKTIFLLNLLDQQLLNNLNSHILFRIFSNFISNLSLSGLYYLLIQDSSLFIKSFLWKFLSFCIENFIIYKFDILVLEQPYRWNLARMLDIALAKFSGLQIDYIQTEIKTHQVENNFLKEIPTQLSISIFNYGQMIGNIMDLILVQFIINDNLQQNCQFHYLYQIILLSFWFTQCIGISKLMAQAFQYFTSNYYFMISDYMEYENIANILQKSQNLQYLLVRQAPSEQLCTQEVKQYIFKKIIEFKDKNTQIVIANTILLSSTEFDINQNFFFESITNMILTQEVLPKLNILNNSKEYSILYLIFMLRMLTYGCDQNLNDFITYQNQLNFKVYRQPKLKFLKYILPSMAFHKLISPNIITNPYQVYYDLYEC